MDNKKERLLITEMIGAKPSNDYKRFYYGSITREYDSDKVLFLVRGNINIKQNQYNSSPTSHIGHVYSTGKTRKDVLHNLDELVTMAVDMGLHVPKGVTSIIAQTVFNHN